MSKKKDGEVLDHAEGHFAAAKRDARAYEILHDSGAAEVFKNIGAAQVSEMLHRMSSFLMYESLRRIAETGGCRFVRQAHSDQPCKNIKQVCEAVGFPKDKYFLLGQEVKALGRAAAHSLEEGGFGRRVRRALLAAPKNVQKAVLDVIAAGNGDKKAVALEVTEIVTAFIAEADEAKRAAEAEAQANLEELGTTERKLKKAEDKLDRADDHLKQIHEKLGDATGRLNMLPFRQDSEVEQILASVRDSLIANVGNFDRAADALVAKTLSDAGRHDQPVELNELALRLAELGVNLWGQTLAKYLEALDPEQNYSQFWALNSLFTSPGAKADIESFRETVKTANGKKGK